ncbi:unnamed protein product [Effrenium voratum]|uniref:Ubiquitin-like domain-containing protein n=1 Tax=Effrenium voratum TaxID=2562239 RepID=A0AA36N0U9_9DINO|nr:unnamed protein product [Effrenium voratum]
MAVFANTSITIKVLEPRKGEKSEGSGDYYWGMVDQAAPKDLFSIKASGAMKVKDLKAAISKEKGYAVESQRLMYFGGELEAQRLTRGSLAEAAGFRRRNRGSLKGAPDTRTLESAGMCNTAA